MRKLILLPTLIFSLTACHTVYPEEIKKCEDICVNNGGMNHINKDLGDVVCMCENGVSIRFE